MTIETKKTYIAPVIEMLSAHVERGYQSSLEELSEGNDYSGSDDPTETNGVRWM